MLTPQTEYTAMLRVHTEIAKEEKEIRSTRKSPLKWYHELPSYLYQYYFIFDCETTIDEKQDLKFGVYEIHGRERAELEIDMLHNNLSSGSCDELINQGIFYNPQTLTPEEISFLTDYAMLRGYYCISVDTFVKLFYFYCHNQDNYSLVIGHNLPFDISRLCKEMQYAKDNFDNGFSLKLCSCTWQNNNGRKHYKGESCRYHPNIRVKKIAPRTHLYEFAGKKPKGNFCDTVTLARALLGPGSLSLASLGKTLNIEEKKLEENIVHGTLTEQYLNYACRDVRATWQIFQKLRDIYKDYNLTKKLHNVLSEASIGKALYRDMHISPPMQRMQNIPPEIHGYAMTAYYGGRCEVKVRKQPVQVAYCDFKSEYPTVFSLMVLQELLLGDDFIAYDCKSSVEMMLDHFRLASLQFPPYWFCIRKLVKISGDNLILPVRTKYNGQTSNIALSKVSIQPTWYTFSDVLANMLLGGSRPIIHEAIEVMPRDRIDTQAISMFDGLIKLDASKDIFTTLIDERTRIKELAEKPGDKQEYYARAQQALKLLANSTSYGINIELRTEEVNEPIMLYGNDGLMQAASHVAQIPGDYYCPVIGTHIPAGGRLLLAIAQKLGQEHGLSYALCDTDSMCFVKPDGMSNQEFNNHIREIREWFKPLYPYESKGELFELEKVNYAYDVPNAKILEPLYCLAISDKRYALYNQGLGSIRIRKVSAHGLGSYQVSENYKPLFYSEVPLKELGLSSSQQWIYDLWLLYIQQANGIDHFNHVMPDMRHLDVPAYHQATISTAYLHKQFSHIPGMKPFNFVTVYPAFPKHIMNKRKRAYPEKTTEYNKCQSALYTPYTRAIEKVTCFNVIGTNEALHNIKPLSVSEALQDYFTHREWKFENGFLAGEMHMRHFQVVGYKPQGKESSYDVIELEDMSLPLNLSPEAINQEYMTLEEWRTFKERIRHYGVAKLGRELDTYPKKISRLLEDNVPPNNTILNALRTVLDK